jgi:hypothetical protein
LVPSITVLRRGDGLRLKSWNVGFLIGHDNFANDSLAKDENETLVFLSIKKRFLYAPPDPSCDESDRQSNKNDVK